jgi:hypothetical protein
MKISLDLDGPQGHYLFEAEGTVEEVTTKLLQETVNYPNAVRVAAFMQLILRSDAERQRELADLTARLNTLLHNCGILDADHQL